MTRTCSWETAPELERGVVRFPPAAGRRRSGGLVRRLERRCDQRPAGRAEHPTSAHVQAARGTRRSARVRRSSSANLRPTGFSAYVGRVVARSLRGGSGARRERRPRALPQSQGRRPRYRLVRRSSPMARAADGASDSHERRPGRRYSIRSRTAMAPAGGPHPRAVDLERFHNLRDRRADACSMDRSRNALHGHRDGFVDPHPASCSPSVMSVEPEKTSSVTFGPVFADKDTRIA